MFLMYVFSKIVSMYSSFNGPKSRISWVIIVSIREMVHSHEVLLDTHAQALNLTANVSVYVYYAYVYVIS